MRTPGRELAFAAREQRRGGADVSSRTSCRRARQQLLLLSSTLSGDIEKPTRFCYKHASPPTVPFKSPACNGISVLTGILAQCRRAQRREPGEPDRAPYRSAPRSPREFVAGHKRRRIMDAIAELTAEQGYDATKIGDIVRRAGVARKTLYDNFEGKEEVFLAAFDAAGRRGPARGSKKTAPRPRAAGRSGSRPASPPSSASSPSSPTLARMCMIEALSATPAATERYEDAMHLRRADQADRSPGRPAAGDDRRDAGRRRRLDRLPADPPRGGRAGRGPAARALRVHARAVPRRRR